MLSIFDTFDGNKFTLPVFSWPRPAMSSMWGVHGTGRTITTLACNVSCRLTRSRPTNRTLRFEC